MIESRLLTTSIAKIPSVFLWCADHSWSHTASSLLDRPGAVRGIELVVTLLLWKLLWKDWKWYTMSQIVPSRDYRVLSMANLVADTWVCINGVLFARCKVRYLRHRRVYAPAFWNAASANVPGVRHHHGYHWWNPAPCYCES